MPLRNSPFIPDSEHQVTAAYGWPAGLGFSWPLVSADKMALLWVVLLWGRQGDVGPFALRTE